MKKMFIGILVVALAAGSAAFTTSSKENLVRYHLIEGKSLNDAQDPGAYEAEPSSYSCDGPAEVPCIIQFDSDEFATLQDYLDSFGPNGQQGVMNAAFSKRAE